MAQINLRDYLKRIDELVDREKYDEGMAHAAHVLRVFPKNLQALRDLGRALFGLSRLAEAEDVFRRVLSANLLDVTAHNYLSLIYERSKQIPLAIWHAERAFDQQPGNKSIVQRLRELYSTQHDQVIDKLPLTAGALANYALSQEPAQALEVLEKALEREPNRLDLRLQLARALWAADRPIDAAETALSILESLPYAMQANRIMTELWLAQGRPSDAARHLSRLEEVDPYLALRLASGETPDPDAILLEELDYMAHANRQLANSVPDWLMALDDDMSDEDPFAQLATDESSDILPPDVARNIEALRGVSATETMPPKSRKPRTGALPPQEKASAAPDKLSKADDEAFLRELEARQPSIRTSTGLTGLLGDNLDDDDAWLNDISDSEAPLPGTPTRAPTGLTGLLSQTASDDDSWLRALEDADPFKQDDAPIASPPHASTGFTGFFDDVQDDAPIAGLPRASTGLTGFFDDVKDTPSTMPRTPTGLTGSFFDDIDDAPPAKQEIELPEWLRDDRDSPAPVSRPKSDADDFIAASDALDPLAWLQESGAELDENAPNARRLNLIEDDGPTIIRSNPINPMAWLSDADGDFFEADNSTPSALSLADDDAASASEEHPLAWLQDESLLSTDALNESNQADTASASADFDQPWFADDDALQEVMDFERLIGADDSASQGQQDAMNNDPLFPDDDSWLSDDADKGQQPEDSSDWLAEFDDELSAEADEEVDPLAWMQGYDLEASADPASPVLSAQATDWLNDSLIEEASESSAELDWMADFGPVSTTQDEPLAQDEPDWMADFGPVSTTQDEPLAQDEPDWMADFGPVSTTQDEPLAQDEPDWMADFGPVSTTQDEPLAQDEPDWMADFGPVSTTQDEPLAQDEPDWMADFGPVSTTQDEPLAQDEPDWMADFGPVSTTQDEPLAQDEPDWMADFGPVSTTQDEPLAQDEPDWMADFGAVGTAITDDEEALVADDQPDWMADFGPVSTTQDEPLAQDEPDWMADFGAVSTTQDEPLAQDEPDWMADFGAALTDDGEFASSEEEAVEEDQLDWMMDFSGVGQQVGAQIEDDLTNASSESFDQAIWDSADETEAEADAYQIDWLSDVANAEEQDELQAEEALSFNPADNAPDWLNAMVPGLDMDFTADEDAVVDVGFVDASSHRQRELSADDFAAVNRGGIQWLHDLIEEEQQAAATLPPPPPPLSLPPAPALASLPPAPQVVQGPLSSAPVTRSRFSFSRPPAWMSALQAQPPAAQKRAAAVAQQEDDDDLEDFDLADFDDLDLDDFDELDDKRKK